MNDENSINCCCQKVTNCCHSDDSDNKDVSVCVDATD